MLGWSSSGINRFNTLAAAIQKDRLENAAQVEAFDFFYKKKRAEFMGGTSMGGEEDCEDGSEKQMTHAFTDFD